MKKFYTTIEEIAECLAASTKTVRRWIDKEPLVAHRLLVFNVLA
jgi:excisionase family DNA binding protein